MKNIGILKRKENTLEENMMYINAIKKFCANPIMISNNNLADLEKCKGILLTGGFNKGELDDYLIKYAIDNKLSLLGICQGMQSMAIYKSNQELINIDNHHKKEGYAHVVNLDDSNISKILNKRRLRVNSHHYQTMVDSLYFNIVGRSDDKVIEAVENKNHKFQIGVQWHPERMLDYDIDSNILLKTFVESID